MPTTIPPANPAPNSAPAAGQTQNPDVLAADDPEAVVLQLMEQYPFPEPPPIAGGIEYAEWGQWCVAQFGFSVEVVIEPGQQPYMYARNITQMATYDKVQGACLQLAREAGHFQPPPSTPEQVRALYHGYLQVQACLNENGYPTVEPPSEDTFVADWLDGDASDTWHPYAATPSGGPLGVSPDTEGAFPPLVTEQLKIQAACPAHLAAILDPATYPGG